VAACVSTTARQPTATTATSARRTCATRCSELVHPAQTVEPAAATRTSQTIRRVTSVESLGSASVGRVVPLPAPVDVAM
jgi:hypothetical protein